MKYVYQRNKNIVFRCEGDEALLFNPDNAHLTAMNQTACFVWSFCDGRHTREDVVNKMLAEFDATPERAEKDVGRFLADLGRKGLIHKKLRNETCH